MNFDDEILDLATLVIAAAKAQGHKLATAESCTGGFISGALTAVSGSSDVVDRGFVTYSNEAKQQMLGVSADSIANFGAISEVVAKEMAYGAIIHSMADIAVSVTGIAGPTGGTVEKPVGTVWMGIASVGKAPVATLLELGDNGRNKVRAETVKAALSALHKAL